MVRVIKANENATCTGIMFQIQGECKKPTKKLWDSAKRSLIDEINKHMPEVKKNDWFIVIGMPCGELLKFKDAKEFMGLPIKDMPCPCGNPKHWFIQFRFIPKEL